MKVVELKLKEDQNGEGITAISLVKFPAIEQNWIAFSENGGQELKPSAQFAFKTIDEEKRILVGPAMIPDKMIFRKSPDGEEYFVFFTEDTVRSLAERFLLHGKQNNMTLEHEATLNDLSVIESWIVEDPEKDKSAMFGFNLPKGSWFVTVKVLNDDIWNMVKANDVAGFSVEGVFTQEIVKQSNSETMSKETKSKLDSYLDKIRGLFTTETAEETEESTETQTEKFGSVEAEGPNGTITITFPGEALEVGAAITTLVEETETPVPTGEYLLGDGTVLVVAEDGVVGEIRPSEETGDEEMETESKDGGLKAAQIDALVDGIAEIIANFQSEVKKQITDAVAESEKKIRAEFNAEGGNHSEETPEGGTTKDKIVRGLAKFVREETKK